MALDIRTTTPSFTIRNAGMKLSFSNTAVGEINITAQNCDVLVYKDDILAQTIPNGTTQLVSYNKQNVIIQGYAVGTANTTVMKLAYLIGTKEAIKTAIVAKGQAVSDTDTFRSYADKIKAIETAPNDAVRDSLALEQIIAGGTIPENPEPVTETQLDSIINGHLEV